MSATIVREPADGVANSEPVTWAIGQLQDALGAARPAGAAGTAGASGAGAGQPRIVIGGPEAAEVRALLGRAGVALPDAPESISLAHVDGTTVAAGSDVRGLVYAVLELADRVRYAPAGDALAALRPGRAVAEQPASRVRSVARLFSSKVEDLGWWHDRGFWTDYLTELVTHRHNRFALTLGLGYNFPRGVTDDYLHFSYPFLLDVPGYDVRARGVSDEERERNLATLRFIGEEVKRRGLHFQLGLWTHAYRWVASPDATHPIEGLTDETHAAYCRDALRLLLERVPTVDGLTFRVHGESGIPEGSYAFWRTVFGAVVEASDALGRRLEIDMHAKGVDQETIDLALETGLPIVISPKYWAEHQGLPYQQSSIREIERLAPPTKGHMAISSGERRHSRYGYTDLLREDRGYDLLFRIWPGTQRLLLWGDPAFAAGFGSYGAFGGCMGSELCEPLTFKGRLGSGVAGNRTGYADESLVPGRDFEKYRYTYRVWGRGTYRGLEGASGAADGQGDPDGWRRYTRHHFGEAAADAEAALAHASRICLLTTTAHGPSANCKIYWAELYTNQPLASDKGHPFSDMTPPKTFGNATSLDPELIAGVDEYAAELVAGKPSGRHSPLDAARWLADLAGAAERHLEAARAQIGAQDGAEFRRWAADIAIQAAVGHFFARKLRAGVGYALFQQTGDAAALREALREYRAARDAFAQAAERGAVYQDDVTFGSEPHQRGHWRDRLPAMDEDIERLESALAAAERGGAGDGAAARRAPALREIGRAPEVRLKHAPPATFRPGEAVTVEVEAPRAAGVASVELRYRHANQAEAYEGVEMERMERVERAAESGSGGVRFRATIPGKYTDSPYPLLYAFRVRLEDGSAAPYPGLERPLLNQPYFLVRHAG